MVYIGWKELILSIFKRTDLPNTNTLLQTSEESALDIIHYGKQPMKINQKRMVHGQTVGRVGWNIKL